MEIIKAVISKDSFSAIAYMATMMWPCFVTLSSQLMEFQDVMPATPAPDIHLQLFWVNKESFDTHSLNSSTVKCVVLGARKEELISFQGQMILFKNGFLVSQFGVV